MAGILFLTACESSVLPDFSTAWETKPAAAASQPSVKAPEPAAKRELAAIPPPTYTGPLNLVGLSGDDLGRHFGTPGFKRHDLPAEVWQFRGDACTLDVFLYTKDRGKTFTVRHFEVRPAEKKVISDKSCFDGLVAGQQTGGAG